MISLDLEASLISEGFEPITVSNCAEAHKWLEVITPEVAILDVLLPDGSCEPIAEMLVDRGVPFVVHSGAPATEYDGTFLARGYWMPKPASSSDVADWLVQALRTVETTAFAHPGP